MKSTQTAGKKLELSKKNQIQLAAMTVFCDCRFSGI